VNETITRRQAPGVYEAMAGAGMATFVRAETFHRLGKFDPEVTGWYHETLDYCVRAWLLGHPMLVEPNIRVLHRVNVEVKNYVRSLEHVYQGALRTAYKYLSPRRRDLAEILCKGHAPREAELALARVRQGNWLSERVRHLKERIHDDDWLFALFGVHEERFTE
jgi:GT2 family glycosyltransferase